MFFALFNGYNFNCFKEIIFFRTMNQKWKKICAIFLFQFKVGCKAAQ